MTLLAYRSTDCSYNSWPTWGLNELKPHQLLLLLLPNERPSTFFVIGDKWIINQVTLHHNSLGTVASKRIIDSLWNIQINSHSCPFYLKTNVKDIHHACKKYRYVPNRQSSKLPLMCKNFLDIMSRMWHFISNDSIYWGL